MKPFSETRISFLPLTFVANRLLLIVVVSATMGLTVFANDYPLERKSDAKQLLKKVRAGDTIVLQDGRWEDVDLKFSDLAGTEAKPIFIRPESPGGAIVAGKSRFRISGQYVEVSGFVFEDLADVDDSVEFRTSSKELANHCRLTDCVFRQTNRLKSKQSVHWLSIHGDHHRVDHCSFIGKTTIGTTLVIWVTSQPGHHRLDHNYFGPREKLGQNGGETIRIGTSQVSKEDGLNLIEENFFEDCDGEAEIISNKSCRNIYRRNVFVRCGGALTLRHGEKCRVDGNVFFGEDKKETGGIRIVGTGHVVVNNYFHGLRGDKERATISVMNGIIDSPLNGYQAVSDTIIAHNTMIQCSAPLEIGVGFSTQQNVAPADCRISHNLWVNCESLGSHHVPLHKLEFIDNYAVDSVLGSDSAFPVDTANGTMKLQPDGLFRPTVRGEVRGQTASKLQWDIDGEPRPEIPAVGCDEPGQNPRVLVTKQTVGPTW